MLIERQSFYQLQMSFVARCKIHSANVVRKDTHCQGESNRSIQSKKFAHRERPRRSEVHDARATTSDLQDG